MLMPARTDRCCRASGGTFFATLWGIIFVTAEVARLGKGGRRGDKESAASKADVTHQEIKLIGIC